MGERLIFNSLFTIRASLLLPKTKKNRTPQYKTHFNQLSKSYKLLESLNTQ
jgi:hypothetical protein